MNPDWATSKKLQHLYAALLASSSVDEMVDVMVGVAFCLDLPSAPASSFQEGVRAQLEASGTVEVEVLADVAYPFAALPIFA